MRKKREGEREGKKDATECVDYGEIAKGERQFWSQIRKGRRRTKAGGESFAEVFFMVFCFCKVFLGKQVRWMAGEAGERKSRVYEMLWARASVSEAGFCKAVAASAVRVRACISVRERVRVLSCLWASSCACVCTCVLALASSQTPLGSRRSQTRKLDLGAAIRTIATLYQPKTASNQRRARTMCQALCGHY